MTATTEALWITLPVPALILDSENRIEDANPAAENFFNGSLRSLKGAPVWDKLMVDAPLEGAFARVRAQLSPLFINDVDAGTGERPPVLCNIQVAPVADNPQMVLLLMEPREIAGRHGHVNYAVIPGVIYTAPEVATVGLTEEALKAQNRKYKVGKFPFLGNGRAKANLVADGFVKMLSDADTGQVLGAHIIGPAAGDLIHEICVGMEMGATSADIVKTCHAHPTFSEAVREAALALGDGAIHA